MSSMNSDELLAPIIDGEFCRNVTKLVFASAPRIEVVAPKLPDLI
jgi:hypothetical protein